MLVASVVAALAATALPIVKAQTDTKITVTQFNDIVDLAAIGYLFAQDKCMASSVTDSHNHVWELLGNADMSDGSNTFAAPLLRRKDLSELYLFFPGSATFDDYITDLRIKLVDYPPCLSQGCQVHEGFYQGWNKSKSAIVKLLREKASPDLAKGYKLVISGGSLGGAIAALAYADFKNDPSSQFKPERGFSLGQPRTGNFAFAKWFNGFTKASPSVFGAWTRVTHEYDAIPKSPPVSRPIGSTPNGDYQHHGSEIWLHNSGSDNRPHPDSSYICLNNAENSESQKCVNGPAIQNPGNVSNHLDYPGYGTLKCT